MNIITASFFLALQKCCILTAEETSLEFQWLLISFTDKVKCLKVSREVAWMCQKTNYMSEPLLYLFHKPKLIATDDALLVCLKIAALITLK